jgi:hypothetical protein
MNKCVSNFQVVNSVHIIPLRPVYCHDHSASIHSHNYRMRQKAKAEAEALQLAKTSELSVEGEQKILFYPMLGKTAQTTASLSVKKLQLSGISASEPKNHNTGSSTKVG